MILFLALVDFLYFIIIASVGLLRFSLSKRVWARAWLRDHTGSGRGGPEVELAVVGAWVSGRVFEMAQGLAHWWGLG